MVQVPWGWTSPTQPHHPPPQSKVCHGRWSMFSTQQRISASLPLSLGISLSQANKRDLEETDKQERALGRPFSTSQGSSASSIPREGPSQGKRAGHWSLESKSVLQAPHASIRSRKQCPRKGPLPSAPSQRTHPCSNDTTQGGRSRNNLSRTSGKERKGDLQKLIDLQAVYSQQGNLA